jgi:hypothetical protein
MDIIEPTIAEMEARVARFDRLKPSKQAFVDTRIPQYARDIYNVIGRGVTEDPDACPRDQRFAVLRDHLCRRRSGQGGGAARPPDDRGLHPPDRHAGPATGARRATRRSSSARMT